MSETTVQAMSFEDALDQVIQLETCLTPEQAANLSKVLFPDTHLLELQFAGAMRKLTPLTVKFARRLHAAIMPFVNKAQEAAQSDGVLSLDDDIVNCLKLAAEILAEKYAWTDVKKKLDEEDVLISELQLLVVHQQKLQGDNDFLLGPLRVLIKLMQTRELLLARTNNTIRSKSTSDMLLSSTDGTAASTS